MQNVFICNCSFLNQACHYKQRASFKRSLFSRAWGEGKMCIFLIKEAHTAGLRGGIIKTGIWSVLEMFWPWGPPPPPSCKQVKLPQCIQQGSPCPTGSPSMRARGPAAKGHAWNYHPHRKRAKSVLQGWPHGIAMQRNNRANDRRGGAELVELIEMQSPLPLSWVLLQLICSFLSRPSRWRGRLWSAPGARKMLCAQTQSQFLTLSCLSKNPAVSRRMSWD